MAKYIIDIPNELAEPTARYWNETTDMTLVPYTESDREAIENEVTDFWKIVKDMDVDTLDKIFGEMNFWTILNSMPYQKAKEKYNEWKRKKEEIHIGDEVQYSLAGYEYTFTVFGKGNDTLYGMRSDKVDMDDICEIWDYCYKSDSTLVKTGRHFDSVEKLLKEMKGE